MGGFNLAGSMGFAVGPILGGWAYTTHGFAFAFLLCGAAEIVLAVVGAVLLIRWAEPSGTRLTS
jgi:MFS family permease